MKDRNSLQTIDKICESKFKEKGSLFIGIAFPIKNQTEIEQILVDLRKEYFDSTHICYAYKLHHNTIKYSDDGEPTGTAGIRLLNAINHFELTNILLVSIRYFGGTKLGVGLLGKTYYQSGLLTLENTTIIKKNEYEKLIIKFDYNLLNTVHYLIKKFDCKILKTDSFENQVLNILLLSDLKSDFIKEANAKTNNQIEIEETHLKEFL